VIVLGGPRPAVLLCRSVKRGYTYLPGGHVEPGEDAASALRRELLEECGLEIDVGPLVAVAEVRFHDGKAPHHEINLVFRATPRGVFHVEHPPADAADANHASAADAALPPPPRSLEPQIDFRWVRSSDIGGVDLRPACLREWLAGWLIAGPEPAYGAENGGVSPQSRHPSHAQQASSDTGNRVAWISDHE